MKTSAENRIDGLLQNVRAVIQLNGLQRLTIRSIVFFIERNTELNVYWSEDEITLAVAKAKRELSK